MTDGQREVAANWAVPMTVAAVPRTLHHQVQSGLPAEPPPAT